ncbi:lethal(2) giant larvae protein homolog 1-like isoform X1 [Clavelina lepadiformis]|uniref:lethal(2) giant larvae protein homolog 1-like isoform X1 n=1 Tax=Clavelina lepadiformis TaxID=159417 RepID=UPI00404216CD
MFRKWKKGTHLDPQREKIKEELYTFKKTVEHGFPHHPCAFAYDPILKLMAIGTKTGAIKVFGGPGIEFTGIHPDVNQVLQLHFLHGEGRLVSILDDNTMHLWELSAVKDDNRGAQELVEIGASQLSGRPGVNQITVVAVCSTNKLMWVGTEGGSIYSLTLPEFEPIDNSIIHQDQVMQSIPDSYKTGKALGPVEAFAEHPTDSTLMLVGYSRGLAVLWNCGKQSVESYYLGEKALEAISWHSNSKEFVSSHIDGSLCTWRLGTSSPHITYTPYGPFPCKAITKILWKSSRNEPHTVFSGGMPRANYGDRHCVSVIHGSKHVTFDFTSRVIDFFIVSKNKRNAEWEEPEFLIVLAEEELIAIDLTQEGWPCLKPPYLVSPHASAITCSTNVDNISPQLWDKLQTAAQNCDKSKSNASWPIKGGIDLTETASPVHNLLVTGHEDGSIKLWDVSTASMSLVLKIQTTNVFITDSEDAHDGDQFDEQFPPFRKVGEFDPYSDDPRLAIRKVAMCSLSGTLVAGGTAGQVVVIMLSSNPIESLIPSHLVDILEGRTDFTWKGHEQLATKESHITMEPGYQLSNVIQCQPPASITSLSIHSNWSLVGIGTGHGFALFDYLQNKSVLSRCTLESGDHSAMEGNFSRAKSFKMSLRQSMRRLRGSFRGGGSKRKRASGRRRYRRENMAQKLQEANAALVDEEETASASGWSPAATGQRRIEARSSEDGMTGMVRCTYFATTFVRDTVSSGPTFWAGTNSGAVYVFALHVPDYSLRQDQEVTSVVGKHIQLMHRAPVVDITVLDSHGTPVQSHLRKGGKASNGSAGEHKSSSGGAQHHSLIISSEEQIKIFALPKISAKRKFKLTAVDGSLVRRIVYSRFVSTKNPDYHEHSLVCLTNLGEIHIIGQLPSLRPQETYHCISRDDPHGMSSAVLSTQGQGFYLISPSEYTRFTLAAANQVEPTCCVPTKFNKHVESSSSLKQKTVQVIVEDAVSLNSNALDKKRSPSKSSRGTIGHAVVATEPSSPKTPLLCDDDDEHSDDDDHRHVEIHESVLEEAERTLAAAAGDASVMTSHSDEEEEEFNIQELLGAVAEAEKVLNEGTA